MSLLVPHISFSSTTSMVLSKIMQEFVPGSKSMPEFYVAYLCTSSEACVGSVPGKILIPIYASSALI